MAKRFNSKEDLLDLIQLKYEAIQANLAENSVIWCEIEVLQDVLDNWKEEE